MTRKTVLCANEYYHVYNRGAGKSKTFISDRDYQRFMALLFACNSEEKIHVSNFMSRKGEISDSLFKKKRKKLVEVVAYCLMGNHFHLLLRGNDIDASITQFMQRVCTGFSMYFNRKYEHSGVVFQGPYKAKHVDSQGYLSQVFEYIHLNPFEDEIREKGFQGLGNYCGYEWSSLDYYNDKRDDFVVSQESKLKHRYLMSPS